MAKPKNHYIYDSNQETLKRLQEEYQMLGRDTRLSDGVLVVLALPKRRKR